MQTEGNIIISTVQDVYVIDHVVSWIKISNIQATTNVRSTFKFNTFGFKIFYFNPLQYWIYKVQGIIHRFIGEALQITSIICQDI